MNTNELETFKQQLQGLFLEVLTELGPEKVSKVGWFSAQARSEKE